MSNETLTGSKIWDGVIGASAALLAIGASVVTALYDPLIPSRPDMWPAEVILALPTYAIGSYVLVKVLFWIKNRRVKA